MRQLTKALAVLQQAAHSSSATVHELHYLENLPVTWAAVAGRWGAQIPQGKQ